MNTPMMKRHYSGNHSKRFWSRVNKIKSDTERSSVYFAGVLLQELEGRVLARLKQAEDVDDFNRAMKRSKGAVRPPQCGQR